MYKDDKPTIGDIFPALKAEYVSKAEAVQATKMRRWTDQEHQVLVQAVRQNHAPEQIAKMLNRTPKAIAVRMSSLGIKYDVAGQRRRTPKRYKKRVTYKMMKSRILRFVKENQPVTMTQAVEGVTGKSDRIRDIVIKMIAKNELKAVYLPKPAGQARAVRSIVLPDFSYSETAPTVKQTRPMQIDEPVKPIEAVPVETDDVPTYSGGALFERNIGNLILFAAVGAAGVWLVMILLAVSLIQNMGG